MSRADICSVPIRSRQAARKRGQHPAASLLEYEADEAEQAGPPPALFIIAAVAVVVAMLPERSILTHAHGLLHVVRVLS